MKDCVSLIHRFSTCNDRKLKKTCSPLVQAFGIDTFFYYSITNQGYFTFVGNQGPMGEFFFHQNLFKEHPCFRHPKFYKHGLVITDANPETRVAQSKVTEEFSLHELIIIINKQKDVVHGYGFATTIKDLRLTNFYYNHSQSLNRFILYFNKEVPELINKVNDNRVLIAPSCGEHFYRPPFKNEDTHEKKFLELINHDLASAQSLSARERECLHWLLRGRTSSQIGQELHLSKKTVENYIENIKNKFGCSSKSELFDQALMRGIATN